MDPCAWRGAAVLGWSCWRHCNWRDLPLARLVLGNLADGGWVFARLLVTVLAGFIVWLGTSTHVFLFRAIWCGLALVLVGLVTWAIRWRWRPERFAEAARPEKRRVAGIGEVVFWSVFVLFLVFRFYNPDSWHTVWGGREADGVRAPQRDLAQLADAAGRPVV